MEHESAYHPDAKPKANRVLNLALAICFSGLFFMLTGAVAIAAFVAIGGKTIDSNLGYLSVMSLYLGLIVVALIAAAFSFGPPETRRRVPVHFRRSIFDRRGRHPLP